MLAIAIINYNEYNKTIECIESIINSNFDNYKIYLLDNGSTNDSYIYLAKKYKNSPRIMLIKSKKNLGYANGNNLLLKYIEQDGCEYAIISNNDIIYNKVAINQLYDKIRKSDYLIVAPQVRLPSGEYQKNNRIKRKSFWDYLLHETYFNKLFPEKNFSLDISREVYWVAGCCFIVNMQKFKKIGYFDKNTFLYYEEYIISEKALSNKYKLFYDVNAKVIHYHGVSMGDVNVKVFLAHLKSELYFWRKYRNASNLKIIMLYCIRKVEIKISLYKRKRKKDYKEYQKEAKKIFSKTIRTKKRKEKMYNTINYTEKI